jgi:hypothetical protein
LVDSSSSYAWSEKDQIYLQQAASLTLLKSLQDTNKDLLGPIQVSDGRQVNQVIAEAVLHPETASESLELVLKALAANTK